MSKWKNPPPVCVVSGTEDYSRRKELSEAVRVAESTGRVVERIRGDDRDGLVDLLSTTGVLFSENFLVIVDNPEKIDAELVKEHHERGDASLALVLNVDGEIKGKSGVARVAKVLPEKLVAKFNPPKPWERDEWATKFVLREFRERGLSISFDLGAGTVETVGADLGVLAFEVEKASLLAKAEGVSEITPDILRQTLTAFSEASVLPVVEALGQRQARALSRALLRVRRTSGGPKSGLVLKTLALVASNVVKWLHIKTLVDAGRSLTDVASEVGLNEYILKKKVMSSVRKWDQETLVRLLGSLAEVERGVRSGWVDPWSVFEARLLAAVR